MRSKIGAALAATLFWALVLVAPAHAAFPGTNGKIAFADGYGGSHVYTINSDGTGQTTLDIGYDPAWSADGRKIAYITGADHLATMTADGSGKIDLGVHPLVGGSDPDYFSYLGDPAWAPDGGQIAFTEDTCYPDGLCISNLWIVNADGSGRHVMFPQDSNYSENYGFSPAWSPDGQWIAFSGACDYAHTPYLTICKAHPDGTSLTPVFHDESDGDSLAPDWSPDGTEIVFSVENCCNYEGSIWKVRADGTGAGVVRAGGPRFDDPHHAEPVWSPDRTKIAFTWQTPTRSSPPNVSVMNSDGSDATQLTYGVKSSWQPILGPQRSDYKNAAQFCKAERVFLGDAAFTKKYGGGANAYGKCVSGK
jgi:Tol biopolymer transport system component